MSRLNAVESSAEVNEESNEPDGSRRRRHARGRETRRSGGLGLFAGLVLVVIGVLYLLQETEILPSLTNWWALFLLLPALGMISAAIGAFQDNGHHWTSAVIGPFLGGLLLVGMTAVFYFGLSLTWLGPLFLIAGGLLLIAGPMLLPKN